MIISLLCGAFAAFRFNAKLEDKKLSRENEILVDEKVAILNKALLNIALQLNVIGNIKRLLNRYNNIDEQAFKMPAEKNFNEKVFVDINEIALILINDPMLLMEISVEQDGFIQTIESLKVRHEHYINELQPNMNKQGLLDRKSNTDEYEELLPYHVFKGAYDSVKVLIHNVQESEKGLEGKFDKLRVSCKKYFPQHQFMELEKHNKNFKRNKAVG
ncbi:hypothetical protein H4J59_16100 [Colwellia sp. MB02u-10]|uniref:hypothetical protein n=1 Tax=Colwellia sp. MB02u-10 TaxID=2759828 RepID=UPI0015F50F26|nr:hypothetical protein [Colwellia sp. MB02u-10]MBA6342516.1 hypothetical protein [Colwellia sp. MB02u-10]